MKHEKLSEALNEISDRHIAEAAQSRKKARPVWVGAVAAAAVLALIFTVLFPGRTPAGENSAPAAPGGSNAAPAERRFLVAMPVYPEMAAYSEDNWVQWRESQQAQYDQPTGYAQGTETFFKSSLQQLLPSDTENTVCSPVNIYMALAMLTEAADGSSRQQLLELLGAESVDAVREQAGHVWNAHYCDDGLTTSVLANSLWLDEGTAYHESTVRTLADSYYASVYQCDLGSNQSVQALQAWLNEQTRGLLTEQSQKIELEDDCVLALASTVYYNAQWEAPFAERFNYDGSFHAPSGERKVTYLYQHLGATSYYWGEGYGAVALDLRDGSKLWLVLPDKDVTPGALVQSGQVLDMILNPAGREKQKTVAVNLAVPKFDIAASTDLIPDLQELGVTELFKPEAADLSALISDDPAYVTQAEHAARFTMTEEGVTAAAYTVITADNGAAFAEEEIDFTLYRPFLFVLESRDGLPMFAGVVNEP